MWEIHFVISSNHWEMVLTEQYCNTHHWNLQKRIEVRGNVNKTCPLNLHYSFTCNTWFTKSISMWRPKHTTRFIFIAQSAFGGLGTYRLLLMRSRHRSLRHKLIQIKKRNFRATLGENSFYSLILYSLGHRICLLAWKRNAALSWSDDLSSNHILYGHRTDSPRKRYASVHIGQFTYIPYIRHHKSQHRGNRQAFFDHIGNCCAY